MHHCSAFLLAKELHAQGLTDSLRRKANARKRQLSSLFTVANSNYQPLKLFTFTLLFYPVDKTKLSCNTPHRRTTTVCIETYPLYARINQYTTSKKLGKRPDLNIVKHLPIRRHCMCTAIRLNIPRKFRQFLSPPPPSGTPVLNSKGNTKVWQGENVMESSRFRNVID